MKEKGIYFIYTVSHRFCWNLEDYVMILLLNNRVFKLSELN
jgi:hypothetical protein